MQEHPLGVDMWSVCEEKQNPPKVSISIDKLTPLTSGTISATASAVSYCFVDAESFFFVVVSLCYERIFLRGDSHFYLSL